MTNLDPWIGEAVSVAVAECGFAAGALGEGPKCTHPPTTHLMSESAMHGIVSLSACDSHARIARLAGVLMGEHPYGPGCVAVETIFQPHGCAPIPPDGEA